MSKKKVMCVEGDITEDAGYTGENGNGKAMKMMDDYQADPASEDFEKPKKKKKGKKAKKKIDIAMAGKEAWAKSKGLKY